jgi:hypothetical protein
MLPFSPYRINSCWHSYSLDDLLKARGRCLYIIKRDEEHPNAQFAGYARVAKAWIPLFDAEIAKRREKGEQTVEETLFEITGNKFTVLETLIEQPRITRFCW